MPTDERKEKHRKYRNILNTVVKAAENKYFTELLSNTKQSVKSLWDTFRHIINPGKKKKSTNIDKLIINVNTITNDNDIANAFNSYFSHILSNLTDRIPPQNTTFKRFMGSMNINSMLLFEASNGELLKFMSQLKSNKSAGSDDMLPKLVKQRCQELCTPLLTIINRSLWEGIFPDKLKIAKVLPFFKKKHFCQEITYL